VSEVECAVTVAVGGCDVLGHTSSRRWYPPHSASRPVRLSTPAVIRPHRPRSPHDTSWSVKSGQIDHIRLSHGLSSRDGKADVVPGCFVL